MHPSGSMDRASCGGARGVSELAAARLCLGSVLGMAAPSRPHGFEEQRCSVRFATDEGLARVLGGTHFLLFCTALRMLFGTPLVFVPSNTVFAVLCALLVVLLGCLQCLLHPCLANMFKTIPEHICALA